MWYRRRYPTTELITAALTFSFCSLPPAKAAEPAAAIPAIQLNQSHYFLGDNIVTAARDRIRIENMGRFKFVLVARAPDWTVTIYRSDDKTYYSESLSELSETGLVSGFLVGRRERFTYRPDTRTTPTVLFGFPGFRSKINLQTIKCISLPRGSSQQVELAVYSTYKMTTNGGLPVEVQDIVPSRDWVTGEPKSNKVAIYLSTRTARSVNVRPDIFDPPKNYTRAKSLREVVSGTAARKESEDAQELFKIHDHK